MLRYPVNPPYKSNAEELITALRHRKADWPSEPGLQTIGPRTIDELLDIIGRERKRRKQDMYGILLIILFVNIGICLAKFGLILLPLLSAYMLVFGVRWRPNARYRYAVYALTQTNDLRVLPTLIQGTGNLENWHPQVRAAILRLLAHVTEEHAGLLDNATQERLWQLGISVYNSPGYRYFEFALIILRALAAIGNQAMLARIKQFVARSERSLNDRDVIAEVQRLVPIMEARLQRQEIPETLLRASDLPALQSDTLLRPTLATTPEPPEHLLRAAGSEPGDTPM